MDTNTQKAKTNSNKTITYLIVFGVILLVGLAVGTIVCLAGVSSRTKLRFLLVDLSGRLIVPTWACKNGSICDRNALAARSVRSGLFAVSWTPSTGVSGDIDSLSDAVWEWDNGILRHYATGNALLVGGAANGSTSGGGPLSIGLSSNSSTLWSTKVDALGRVSFSSQGSNQVMASAIVAPSSPAVVALPSSMQSDSSYSVSFVTLPWVLT